MWPQLGGVMHLGSSWALKGLVGTRGSCSQPRAVEFGGGWQQEGQWAEAPSPAGLSQSPCGKLQRQFQAIDF